MNAIEIEQAVTALSETPLDRVEFPYVFLMAIGKKDTTVKRLRTGTSNKSDLDGVLQANNLHIAIADKEKVNVLLNFLKGSTAIAISRNTSRTEKTDDLLNFGF